ncbi:alpha/beta hydrolase [Metapseudomonas otitidis]|uniref:alpha/beta hydrolase n=1 Tax=Metapseudomonas otitidis TaxID=319939 RepID=UPI003CF2D6C2
MRLTCLLLALLLLGGCAARDHLPDYSAQAGKALPATWYDAVIIARDGTRLSATVFQPALAAGETAPLVVHTHGWGGWRVTGPDGFYGQRMISGRTALRAWRAGYWVVSYDQRGWGGSEGDIEMMDPRYEVQDALAVVDWASAHLPRLTEDGPGDPRVGMLGESYGGAVQLLAASEDPRIDVLVPIATWYDLADALAPGGRLKVGWTGVLVSLGLATGYDLGKFIQAPYLRSAGGELTEPVRDELHAHSLAAYCEQGRRPRADALLIQGLRDTLFPLDQGLAIRDCLRQGSADVRLLGIQGGHILPPPLQQWSGLPPFNNEPVLHCDGQALNLETAVVNWYEDRLRGRHGAADSIPRLCLSLSTDEGLALREAPRQDSPLPLPETRLRPATSGWLQPAAFVELKRIDQQAALVGPTLLHLRPRQDDHEVFAALAVRRANGDVEVLSEQVTPLAARADVRLPSVSTRLQPGDRLGLRFSGFSGQYLFNGSWWPGQVSLAGEVELPELQPLPH